jgi:hypothetical protein
MGLAKLDRVDSTLLDAVITRVLNGRKEGGVVTGIFRIVLMPQVEETWGIFIRSGKVSYAGGGFIRSGKSGFPPGMHEPVLHIDGSPPFVGHSAFIFAVRL